jgi:hypothetical protein
MAEADLLKALRQDYKKLDSADRKQKIREIAAESKENKKFIQKFFPEFCAEAFPSRDRRAARKWESSSRPGLCSKLR